MFGRGRPSARPDGLDGVMTFFGSFHALRSESVLKKAGFPVRLIPGPREISPNCGVALRFSWGQCDQAVAEVTRNTIQFEAVHLYPEDPSVFHQKGRRP